MKNKVYKKNIAWRVRKIDSSFFVFSGTELYELDELSTFIYKNIDSTRSCEDIAKLVCAEYDGDYEEIFNDIVELLIILEGYGVISTT